MFEINFNEQQLLIQKTVRDFSENEIKPVVIKFDEAEEFPLEIFTKLGEMGFLGILVPEKYGGSELGYVDYAMIVEEIAKVDPSIALSVAAHNGLCTNHILLFGNEKQKEKYLPDLATGRKIGIWGLTEPTSGSDAGSLLTTAEKRGNKYYLNGSKSFATHGTVGQTAVIMAKIDKEKGKHGISAFIVEKTFPGFIVGKKENKLGCRACETTQLAFENCEIPEENLLGAEGEGFINSLKVLEGGRISIAAMALGIAEGACEACVKYSKERKQFGKFLSEFQATQFKLADMKTAIEAARLLLYRAASAKDEGKDINLIASQAKLFASEAAVKITNEAIQIHGGYGFIKEFPVEKFYRDVKLTTIGEGTSEIQRIVIAKSLLESL